MATLFSQQAGNVLPIKEETTTAGFLTVEGFELSNARLLATSFRIDRGQISLHQKTFDNDFYSYAFGEAPAKIMVGGYVFFNGCGEQKTGMKDLNTAYEANNIYSKGKPVAVSIGGVSFQAYLENLSLVGDMNQFNFGSFSMGFTYVPTKQENSTDSNGIPTGESGFNSGVDGSASDANSNVGNIA